MKSVLVPVMFGRDEPAALRLAAAIAQRHRAQLTAVVGLSAVSPAMTNWDFYPAGAYDTLAEAARAAAAALAATVAHRLADCGGGNVVAADALWRTPAEQCLPFARCADLVVLGRPPQAQDAERRLFAALLLESGRPLLLAPAGTPADGGFRHVLVAWKPTREAARAVHDALPLLAAAEAVTVLTVGEDAAAGATLAERLLPHLARHGVAAGIEQRPRGGEGSGEAILRAAALGADLIVAGGYGRARLSEAVFGGVTRHLFEHASVPVLLSH